MPASLIRRIYRGWKRLESYWDTLGMNENLKFIGDHLPNLNVVGVDPDAMPSSAVQGAAYLHTATGEYSIYSMDADVEESGWTRYPASNGLVALFSGVLYGNTGSAWVELESGVSITPGAGITVTGDGSDSNPFVISSPTNSTVVTAIPNFTMDNATFPSGGEGRNFINPPAGNWNLGAGRMTFTSDVIFNNYFTANPGGHMAIVLRQDPALSTTAVRGNGVAIGNLVGASEGTQVNPGAQIELWANSVNPQGMRLVPGAESPEPLVDGTYYKLVIESSVADDGNRYARMAVYKQTARGYDCVVDTGDVLDTLVGSDFSKTGLLIGHVFGSNVSGWSIAFTNSKVTWGSFAGKKTDTSYINQSSGGVTQSFASGTNTVLSGSGTSGDPFKYSVTGAETKLSQGTNVTITGSGTSADPYVINAASGSGTDPTKVLKTGDTMTGNLNMSGDALRFGIQSYVGLDYQKSFRIQNTIANASTMLLTIPNGTGNTSSFTSGNKSDLTAAGSYVSQGMVGSEAILNTFGINGGATPNYKIQIGGVTVATFTATGATILGLDGSETKINPGTNVTITGSGTAANPYVINSSGGGTAQTFASGTNTTLSGAGTSVSPYKYSVGENQSLNFSGDALRLGAPNYVGADYQKSFRYQNTVANAGTSFLTIPNGTATAANHTAGNTSNLAGAGSYVSTGMVGSEAITNTFGLNGGATPIYKIQLNGTTIATFAGGGIVVKDAVLPIGAPSSILTGPFNTGGSNAIAYAQSSQNIESFATIGTIKNFLQTSYGYSATQADGVESVTRPLFAYVSCLLADLQARKVI